MTSTSTTSTPRSTLTRDPSRPTHSQLARSQLARSRLARSRPARSRPARSRPARSRPAIGHGPAFWVVATAFLMMLAFSTVPTPLYAIYQERDGFATPMITVVFAVYAVGVAASLYFTGHLSDWAGRRRMVLIAGATEIAASLVFLQWPQVPGLIVARVLTGVGVGMLTATATAFLAELRSTARPHEDPGASSAVSGLVNMGGFAVGPLVAGALAQFVGAPLVVPFAAFLIALVCVCVLLDLVPETVQRVRPRPAYAPQRLRLPTGSRPQFAAAATGAAVAFAINGMFMSLTPSILVTVMGQPSHLAAGAMPFAVFGAAALVPAALTRVRGRAQAVLALTLSATGILALAVSVLTADLPLFVVAGTVAGAGTGILFRSAVAAAGALAEPAVRGEVLAALFLTAYTGLAVPVLLIGLALAFSPLVEVLVVFAAVALVLLVVSSTRMLRA